MTPGQLSGSAGYSEDTDGTEGGGFGPHPSQELGVLWKTQMQLSQVRKKWSG